MAIDERALGPNDMGVADDLRDRAVALRNLHRTAEADPVSSERPGFGVE